MPVNDARKAVGMFKDEYLLDYINVEEIEVDNSEDIDEKVWGDFFLLSHAKIQKI